MPDEVFIALESIGDDAAVSVDDGLNLLSPAEKKRARSFRFDIHRNRYIRGRAILRKKLSQYSNCAPEAVVIEEEERGKPYVAGNHFAFNLSHSGDIAMLAISTTAPRLGVDIEMLERDTDFDGLSQHYFSAGECRELSGLPDQERRKLFFRIWTAKEARMKLSGDGLHLDPRDIDLEFTARLPSGYLKPVPGGQFLKLLDYPEIGAVASIAADGAFDICKLG